MGHTPEEIARAFEEVIRDLREITNAVFKIEIREEHSKEVLRELKVQMREIEGRVATAEGKFEGAELSKQIAELRQALSVVQGKVGSVEGSTMKRNNPLKQAMPVEKPVFISYSREDQDWVIGQLLPHLSKHSISYTIDTQFPIGSDWEEEINKALRDSRAVIAVLSPNYIESDWATAESLAANRVIPMLIAECELPLSLSRRNYLNFCTGEPWDELTAALLRMGTA